MLNLDDWQLDAAAPHVPSVKPKGQPQKRRAPFLKGPVPLAWLAAASQLPGRALAVGIALWFQAGLHGSQDVKLTNQALSAFGVDRFAKKRALDALEEAGLVLVKHQRGRSPQVRILTVPEAD
ncbi:hypothetical protein [Caenispirillum bisanense]|uniref:hypothetical protein n=1 Tax=Caenispirillum bisanense TaxID=414052 RepID=UPI001142740B|nr:hypothetical protein [Caenispirillum bisanense]